MSLIAALAGCEAATPTIESRNPPTLEAPEVFQQDVNTTISLENVANLSYLGRLSQLETPGTLFSYAVSPDSTRLVGVSDTLLIGWNLTDGAVLFQTSRQGITQIYYSPDKTELYGIKPDGAVLVFNPDTGAVTATFEGIDNYAQISAFDKFNGWLAMGANDGSVKVWDPFTRVSQATIQAHAAPVTGLTFSADGDEIITASGERMLRRYRWSDRDLISEREVPRATTLVALTASPGGDWIAASTDFNAVLWSVSDPSRVIGLETGQGGANQILMFSPDGQYLIAGNRVSGLTLWNIANAELAARLPNTISSRVSAAFSPDGSILLSSALDVGVYLWNLEQVTTDTVNQAALDAGTTRIHSVAWTDDSRLLLLFDAGGAVYLWGISG